MISKNVQKWVILQKTLSVNEMTVRYYGHHTLKQFIKSNRFKFEYKLWALRFNDDYCYILELRSEKELNTSESKELPLCTKVVLNLISIVENPKKHRVYFKSFFSSHKVVKKLNEIQFKDSGTIRENLIEK